MEHGYSWFHYLPFFEDLRTAIQGVQSKGIITEADVVAQHVIAALFVALTLFILGISAGAKARATEAGDIVPSAKFSIGNLIEYCLEGLYGTMRGVIGEDCGRYFPIIGSLALFIFFSNILGLVPGFLPPTENWNTTFACGIVVFFYYNYHGLRVNGMAHISHIFNPVGIWWGWFLAPVLGPIEIVSHLARPFSLGVRLATNMVGDHAVLGAFIGMAPWVVPVPFFFLGLLVCTIQTFVFVLLSMIYIGLSVQDLHHGHDDHGDEGHGAVAHA